MWSRFAALPPYFGGKRQLCPVIFKAISGHLPQADWPRMTLVDAFCGGGAVSLYAKAQGMRVLANDLAERSKVIMDALIANDRVTIGEEDVYRLFVDGAASDHFVEQSFVPEMFMQRHAAFIDRAMASITQIEHRTKARLLKLLLIRYMFAVTPYSQIHSVNYHRWIENEEFHRLGMSRTKKVPYTAMHPLRILMSDKDKINRGVFPNGHRNEAYQEDVFEFLARAEGDICYLDPPYAGAQAYEKFYEVLDQILAGQRQELTLSEFNLEQAKVLLGRLLEASRKFRVVIVSYGSQRYPFEEFQELVRRIEPQATCMQLQYRYTMASKGFTEQLRKELLAVITHGA